MDNGLAQAVRILPQRHLFLRLDTTEDRYALAPLALFDRTSRRGHSPKPPYGTNMAFHKSVFEKHGASVPTWVQPR